MYADTITPSMARAIEETNRRREKQVAYNAEHGIDPTPLRKKIADITDLLAREDADTEDLLSAHRIAKGPARPLRGGAAAEDLAAMIAELTDQMHAAAGSLQFEVAARYRDEIAELKKELRAMTEAAPPSAIPD